MKLVSGIILMGILAIILLGYECDFVRRAQTGHAVVIGSVSHGKNGLTSAESRHLVDGRQVQATIRTGFCHLRPGQRVRVLYLRDAPENVVPDWFWQRHYRSILATAVFASLVVAETLRFRRWQRRQASLLLCDEYVRPGARSRGTPSLPIDTTPRLWDRELDE